MAECEWIVLCDYAFMAAPSKVSVIGLFDVIWAHAVPVTHERAFVAFNILGEPGERVTVRLEIIGPNGLMIAQTQGVAVLPDSGGAKAFIELRNMTMTDFGRHAIQVDLGDGQPKSAWFTLLQAQADQ